MAGSLFNDIDHSVIRYSKVWEDCRIASSALKITSEDNLLIISSAGCNALNLAIDNPRSIMCVDVSESQTALTELKVRAISVLGYNDFLELLGLRRCLCRLAHYELVRPRLSECSRNYWDKNINKIRLGVHCSGRLDKYFMGFWQGAASNVVNKDALEELARQKLRSRRKVIFENLFHDEKIEAAFVRYFGRKNMIKSGRHESQFKYVNKHLDVGRFLWERFGYAMIEHGVRDNPYMQCFLNGQYDNPQTSLPYLSRVGFYKIKAMANRINVCKVDFIDNILNEKKAIYNKYYLSNIFEYRSEEDTFHVLDKIGAISAKGSIACYWNFLVERGCLAPSINLSMITDVPESKKAHIKDRSWIYRAFWITKSRDFY